MPERMLAARLHGPGDLRLEEVPVPEPGPGEVVIRVERALTCGTDVKIFRRGRHPALGPLPSPFGHEVAGEVVAMGEGVTDFRPGMRVVAANSAPCGSCRMCQRGEFSLCPHLTFFFGAFAQYARIPAPIVRVNLYPIPDSLPAAAAALVEPLACALRGVEAAEIRPGETVLVLGGGALGLMLAHLAKLRGAAVALADPHPERREAARSIGVGFLLDPRDALEDRLAETFGELPDVVIEAVGRVEAWEAAAELARPGGRVILFGGCPVGTRASFDTARLHYRELTLRGVFHHHPRFVRAALSLLRAGQIPVDLLISGELPLPRLLEAFERMERRQGFKFAIDPWSNG
ncbi:MAG: alcohol dehydrogenase catalytic domain-containing protein [Thermoflexus sp.]|jgi:L-iditol 2-dehydrogenase|nr:alcohol dehydrogenase catalytic domain-containing protein [Thermoflexus sp.]